MEKPNYDAFDKFVRDECMYDALYDDQEGRRMIILSLLDLWVVVNRWQKYIEEKK